MKHWIITTILLATIMLGGLGCNEVKQMAPIEGQKVEQKAEQKEPRKCESGRCYPDEKARKQAIINYGQISKNLRAIKDLEARSRADTRGGPSIHVKPIPVPIIPVPPDAISPRLPKTRINKSKKFTNVILLGPFDPAPLPSPGLPYPRPIPC